MEEKFKERLNKIGVNVESALERFMGNETLYEKFVRGFTKDKTYDGLIEAMKAGDVKKAFLKAHTLKGVCANLSFIPLLESVDAVVEPLRDGNMEMAQEYLPELAVQYKKTLKALQGEEDE